jgi:diguanylate cyclase (GGDEF)-like protein
MTDLATTEPTVPVRVALEQLPSPPGVALEIIRIAADPDSSPASLANVISRDPVLAARLIRLANSPTYARGNVITTIERAAAQLGVKAVKLMALSFSLVDEPRDLPGLDADDFWFRSLLTATAARRWALAVGSPMLEEAFLAGLLSHLGRLVLARSAGGRYAALVADVGPWPTATEESYALGVSSDEITARLLNEWTLPALITTTVVESLDDRGADNPLGHAVSLAQHTQRALHPTADHRLVEALRAEATALGLDDAAFDVLIDRIGNSVLEFAALLRISLPAGAAENLLQEARLKLVTASIETALAFENLTHDSERLREENTELGVLAHRDALTGLANRGVFDDQLGREVAARLRDPQLHALGLLIIDIDHFKQVNDTYGHVVGDEVLRAIGACLNEEVRASELVARYGGEEFVVLLRADDMAAVVHAGERFRQAVEALTIPTTAGPLKRTVSVGGAHLTTVRDAEDGLRLIRVADAALYAAKAAGRNQTRSEPVVLPVTAPPNSTN